jgi:ABC-2 type transport system ATP-binding protein
MRTLSSPSPDAGRDGQEQHGGQIVIRATALTRTYGDFVAVDAVDFSIGTGEIVGLLGHNGAGKTTIMKMLSGYLEPSGGTITIGDIDVATEPKRVQRLLGYLPENLPLYPELTVIDYLDFAAELRGVGNGERAKAVRAAIDATELGSKALDTIDTLSRGYRQRVGVAQAIVHRPRFLILDEPTNGLDPSQTQQMRDLIKQLAQQATVMLSTHIMQEVNAICDRAMILRNGKLVLDERLSALQTAERLVLSTDAELQAVAGVASRVQGLGPVTEGSDPSVTGRRRFAVALKGKSADAAAAELAQALVGAGIRVFALGPEQRDLESVFRTASAA